MSKQNLNNIEAQKKRCVISRYDETIEKPPFLTIPIDRVEVFEPLNDELGVWFAFLLQKACAEKGYVFKFYTSSSEEDTDYEIVVF